MALYLKIIKKNLNNLSGFVNANKYKSCSDSHQLIIVSEPIEDAVLAVDK